MNINIVHDTFRFCDSDHYFLKLVYPNFHIYKKYEFKYDNYNYIEIININNNYDVNILTNNIETLNNILNFRILKKNSKKIKSLDISYLKGKVILVNRRNYTIDYQNCNLNYDFSIFSNLKKISCVDVSIHDICSISKNIKIFEYMFLDEHSLLDFNLKNFNKLVYLNLHGLTMNINSIKYCNNLRYLFLKKVTDIEYGYESTFKTFKDLKYLEITDYSCNYQIDHYIKDFYLMCESEYFEEYILKNLLLEINFKVKNLYLDISMISGFDDKSNLFKINCENLYIIN